MDDEAIDALRRVYNDAYCEQRRAGVSGGEAERSAMRELLTHVITEAVTAPNAGAREPDATELLRRLDAALRAAWDARTLPASVIPAELAQAVEKHLSGVQQSEPQSTKSCFTCAFMDSNPRHQPCRPCSRNPVTMPQWGPDRWRAIVGVAPSNGETK